MQQGEYACFRKGDVRVFVDLGLTSLQARAYLALSFLGTATIKSVSKSSNIARQDVYRLMPLLQQLGLAEKVLTTPLTYKATPLKDGVNVLLRRKSEEYSKLQTEIENMANNFQTTTFKIPFKAEDSKFFIISEKKLLYKTLDEKNQTVQKSLRVAGTWESSRGALFNTEQENFRKALKKGVKIRWITEDHEEDKSTVKTLKELVSNPLFEIRYFAPPIPLQAAIYDEKEVVMCVAQLPSPDVTSIWSDNPMFVKVAVNYWEEVWNASIGDYSKGQTSSSNQKLLTQ